MEQQATEGASLHFIDCHPPYAWRELVDFLAPRAINGVEEVRDGEYRRVVSLNSDNEVRHGWISVSYDEKASVLRAEVSVSLAPILDQVLVRLKRLFDTEIKPENMEKALGSMTKICPGLRVPGCFDAFEWE